MCKLFSQSGGYFEKFTWKKRANNRKRPPLKTIVSALNRPSKVVITKHTPLFFFFFLFFVFMRIWMPIYGRDDGTGDDDGRRRTLYSRGHQLLRRNRTSVSFSSFLYSCFFFFSLLFFLYSFWPLSLLLIIYVRITYYSSFSKM